MRRKRKTRRKLPHLPTSVYIQTADNFDIIALYGVMVIEETVCPSKKWFADRARLNRYTIAQHTIERERVIVRLK